MSRSNSHTIPTSVLSKQSYSFAVGRAVDGWRHPNQKTFEIEAAKMSGVKTGFPAFTHTHDCAGSEFSAVTVGFGF